MIETRGLAKRFGDRRGAQGGQLRRASGRAAGDHRPQRRGQDDAALDPRRDQAPGRRYRQPPARRDRLDPPAGGALPASDRDREPAPVRPPGAGTPTSMPRWRRCSSRRGSPSAATTRSEPCRAETSSASTSPSASWRGRWCCCSTSRAPGLDPRQRERLWEFVLGLAGGGTTVIFSTHNIAEAERYGQRLLVLADGEALFDGTSADAACRRSRVGRARLRAGVRRLPAGPRALSGAELVRWLFLKDLQILRRSPLVTALLVVYPVAIAVLIGFALSRGPETPRVAFLNQVPEGQPFVLAGTSSTSRAPGASSARGSTASGCPARSRPGRWSSRATPLRRLILPPDLIDRLESLGVPDAHRSPPSGSWSTRRTPSRPAWWTIGSAR